MMWFITYKRIQNQRTKIRYVVSTPVSEGWRLIETRRREAPLTAITATGHKFSRTATNKTLGAATSSFVVFLNIGKVHVYFWLPPPLHSQERSGFSVETLPPLCNKHYWGQLQRKELAGPTTIKTQTPVLIFIYWKQTCKYSVTTLSHYRCHFA
jgi:hypothetical protein